MRALESAESSQNLTNDSRGESSHLRGDLVEVGHTGWVDQLVLESNLHTGMRFSVTSATQSFPLHPTEVKFEVLIALNEYSG